MSLSRDFISYGIHSLVPYRRTDRLPYGIFKIIGGGTLSLSSEYEDLFGGSNRYAWASEAKTISSTFSASVKSFPDFLFELFLGATVTTTAASSTGSVGTITNVKGSSVVEAATGIASAAAKSGSETDLKDATYIVKAVTTDTVDVYATTDVSFSNGNDLSFQDDLLKITASPLTITASTAVEVPNTGIELTGGSGTIGMTADDTAYFKVQAAHGGVSEIIIGKNDATFPEHGQVLVSAKRSDGSLMEIDVLKAVGAGFPIQLEETVFAIPELEVKLLYDAQANAVAKITKILGEG